MIYTRRQRIWNRKHRKLIYTILLLAFIAGFLFGKFIASKIFAKKVRIPIGYPNGTRTDTQIIEKTEKVEATTSPVTLRRVEIGKASYYTVNGCIGCSKNRQMANSEILDDTKLTLAHNTIPLNTIVEVVNTRNGKKATAKITDRGGFSKYNRIADLSLALAKQIDLKTDIDILTITPAD